MKLFHSLFIPLLTFVLGFSVTPVAHTMEAAGEVAVEVPTSSSPLAMLPSELRQPYADINLWEAVQDWEPSKDKVSSHQLETALTDGAAVDEPTGGLTILYYAASRGSLVLVQTLLAHIKKTYDPAKASNIITTKNRGGLTALHVAARKNFLDIANVLLDAGADLTIQDDAGNTALHWAINLGHYEMATLLLAKKPNPTIITTPNKAGFTPLHAAASRTDKVCFVERLIEELVTDPTDLGTIDAIHAAVNTKDNAGNTPLHRAILSGNLAAIETLCSHSADATIANHEGQTPFDVAKELEATEALTFLEAGTLSLSTRVKRQIGAFFASLGHTLTQ